MRHVDVPSLVPPLAARPLTPAEIVRLARGERPPGLPDDPRTRAIARCQISSLGWDDFDRARRRKYLVLVRLPHRQDVDSLAALWGWWCAAARWPEVVVRLPGQGGAADLSLDLAPAGLVFTPAALEPIGHAWLDWAAAGDGWLATNDTVQVENLPHEAAHALAQALLRIAADGRWAVPERVSGSRPTS